MRYFFPFLFFVLFLGNSCKKKELVFEFEGNIKSLNSGVSLKGVKIEAYSYALLNSSKDLIGSTVTDAGGNYSLKLKRGKYKKIKIELSKNNYFNNSKSFPFDDLSTETTNSFNSTLSPKSWTKFIIKDIYSNDPNDELKIQKVGGKTDCPDCCSNSAEFYHGVVDTVVICPNDGDTYTKFYYWVNGQTLNGTGKDSVYNTPFDTIPFPITY